MISRKWNAEPTGAARRAATSESPFVRSRLGRFFERNSTVQREASGPSPTGVEDGGGTEPV